MKLPIDWLRDFVHVEETPLQLGELFTQLGFGVEAIEDATLDLEITPNRGDCLSIIGLAREYGALKNKPVKIKKIERNFASSSKKLTIKSDGAICSRYSGAIINNIKLKQSSPYLQDRLRSYGITPHNNIIDITNLVMVETGQPLHAFDLDTLRGKTLTIRKAKKGERLTVIHDQTINLGQDNVIIADSKGVIDLAGITGGKDFSILPKTKNILLQAAVFDAKAIRRSAKASGVHTEASYRYERSVDPSGTHYAIARALELIEQEAHGQVSEVFDLEFKKTKKRVLELHYHRVRQLLGSPLDPKLIKNYLMRLNFGIVKETPQSVAVVVPSYRLADIQFEEDLVEEIGRLHGYGRLARRLIAKTATKPNTVYQAKRALITKLSEMGFVQIQGYSFVSGKEVRDLGLNPSKLRILSNPLSPEQALLRPTLMIGALKAIQKNAWWPNLKIFEIGRVFSVQGEQENVLIAASPTFEKQTLKIFGNIATTAVSVDHPLAKRIKLRHGVEIIETSLEFLIKKFEHKPFGSPIDAEKIDYRPYSPFPPLVRDIAIIVEDSTAAEGIIERIKSVDQRILLVELFDEFRSEKFGTHKKSLAFRIVFDDPAKTMADSQADELMKSMEQRLAADFAARIR